MPSAGENLEQKALKKAVEERRKCAEDAEYFIEKYCWIFNPHKSPAILPFVLWPHQKRLLAELLKYLDLFSEKSRDMGISWLVMAFQLHQSLFTDGFTSLNVSRRESEVEDPGKTYHSLFGRLDFIYRRLPNFLRLRVNNPFLTFQVPATNSVIKGESANPNAGRDTQYKFIFVDEAAHIERDVFREMWKAIRNSTNSLFINSTPPKNIDNKYVELRNMVGSGFGKIRFHWSEHPEKDQEWFKKKTASMTEDEIKQELEISYDKVRESRSYPEFEQARHLTDHKIYLNPLSPLYLSFDFGLEGEAIGFYQLDKWQRLFLLLMYQKPNLLTAEHVRNITHILGELGFRAAARDISCFGDPAGKKRARTSKTTVISEYAQYGFKIQTRNLDFDEKRRTVKSFLKAEVSVEGRRSPKFIVNQGCDEFVQAIGHCRMNKAGTDHVDDWTTHKVNSFEYIVCNLFPLNKAAGILVNIDPEISENNRNKILSPAGITGSIFGRERRRIW